MSKSKLNNLKYHIQWLIIQIITWSSYHLSINIKLWEILLFPVTFLRIVANHKKWETYIEYKNIIGNNKNGIQFIINTYTRKISNSILSRVLYSYPDYFSKYVILKGEHYVKDLQHSNKGVLVIGNHGGPFMLQTFLFSKIFNIPLSSYSASWLKNNKNFGEEINQLIEESPVYFTGEEKKFLNALLSGEWINILLDVTVNSHHSPNCVFANHNIQFSKFPFRIALKYDIPILYVEIKREEKGNKIQINIQPINNFLNAEEGLNKYVQYLESTIFSDNYSNTLMPFVLKGTKTTTV
nr:hypothetical protein [uncultured Draconibacterium sp.]